MSMQQNSKSVTLKGVGTKHQTRWV